MSMCRQQQFHAYFKENMEALGLAVPSTHFQTQADAAAMIAAMLTAFKTSGRRAACGTSIADVMMDVHHHGVVLPMWIRSHFVQHSEMLNQRHAVRMAYAAKARR